jgi:hypothetical protein
MTRHELRRLRAEYLAFIMALEPSHFVTFNFGYTVKPLDAFPRMKGACCAVERRALGRLFYKHRRKKRLIVLGFPEHFDTNMHWHCVARVPAEMEDVFTEAIAKSWLKLVPRGQIDESPIENLESVSSYCTKRLHLDGSLENAFLYSPH